MRGQDVVRFLLGLRFGCWCLVAKILKACRGLAS